MINKTSLFILVQLFCFQLFAQKTEYQLNKQDYYEKPGINLMVFQDFYPDGHQGGVTVVQNGIRVVANGDLRLEPTPGQWSPVPKKGTTKINRDNNEIAVHLWYPDSTKNRTGFNPIEYPDLKFKYWVRVKPEGAGFRVQVDLEEALPDEWYDKAGFNLELFPGFYFGKSFMMDGQYGIFNRQFNGPIIKNKEASLPQPMASGKKLLIVPENKDELIVFEAESGLELLDGRAAHNNGWFIVRAPLQKGKLKNAINLLITPHAKENYLYEPVIQVSQVGYHSEQEKKALIELDASASDFSKVQLMKVSEEGGLVKVKEAEAKVWGNFLRYKYLQFDFSEIKESGIYKVVYGDKASNPFKITTDIYDRDVWQPTLEYYLPVQMCHMRINDRYKVWHDWCHLDDALIAPIDLNHFDGYLQGTSTLTNYKSMQQVPGLDVGGWHDAGDYDLRVESQATTVLRLAQMQELFGVDYDITSVDQQSKVVEMHQPDGVADIIQQIEHGVLTIMGGYKNLGRLYRGIICPDLRQYTLLGDASSMTDNLKYDANLSEGEKTGTTSSVADDRWVFTEENPSRELGVASALAVAARVLKGYNDALAKDCLEAALHYWNQYHESQSERCIDLAAELLLSTGDDAYKQFLITHESSIVNKIGRTGVSIAKVRKQLEGTDLLKSCIKALKSDALATEKKIAATPFGVEYSPNIWGAGWGIQSFGVKQYFLHKGFPEIYPKEPVLNALNFVLGVHPGSNTASFASGVGSNSVIVAYGVNRDEWSYIPGGSVSGTALIRPDLPELKEWPYFWQQTEYVMGGGATNFMFLVLAAQNMLNE
ncbi:MAG: glycoside hydrolase [Thalassobius sp.]|nr:glycoside hydrolase [Thalassovita sp.]